MDGNNEAGGDDYGDYEGDDKNDFDALSVKVDWSKEYKVTVDRPAVLPCDEGLFFSSLLFA